MHDLLEHTITDVCAVKQNKNQNDCGKRIFNRIAERRSKASQGHKRELCKGFPEGCWANVVRLLGDIWQTSETSKPTRTGGLLGGCWEIVGRLSCRTRKEKNLH